MRKAVGVKERKERGIKGKRRRQKNIAAAGCDVSKYAAVSACLLFVPSFPRHFDHEVLGYEEDDMKQRDKRYRILMEVITWIG